MKAPKWIVNDMGELGVEIDDKCYFLYKGDSIRYYENETHEDGTPILYRMVGKREFGETCKPFHWWDKGHNLKKRYTEECVHTPGLSFGPPNNPDYQWKPVPLQKSISEAKTILDKVASDLALTDDEGKNLASFLREHLFKEEAK